MKGIRALATPVAPLPIAQVLMHANLAGTCGTRGEIGQNHRDMTDLRDDRVGLVGFALAVATRMDMDIGDDAQARRATVSPQGTKPAAVYLDDAGRQRMRIDVVIEDEFVDLPLLALSAEEEGTGLAPAAGAAAQLRDAGIPDVVPADKFRRRPEDDARER